MLVAERLKPSCATALWHDPGGSITRSTVKITNNILKLLCILNIIRRSRKWLEYYTQCWIGGPKI